MKNIALVSILPLSLFFVVGCSVSTKSEDDTVHATVTLETGVGDYAKANEGQYQFTKTACTKDSNSGLFTGSFTAKNGAVLSFQIKGHKSSADSYVCTQAENNKSSESSIGDKFDTCGLEISVPKATTSTSMNTYATYRSDTAIKPFTSPGSCTIKFSDVSASSVTGTITCTKLVMTKLEGSPRNPMDTSLTIDMNATSSFDCSY